MLSFCLALCLFVGLLLTVHYKRKKGRLAKKTRPKCIVWGCPTVFAEVEIKYEALGSTHTEALCKGCFGKRMKNMSMGIGWVDPKSVRTNKLG